MVEKTLTGNANTIVRVFVGGGNSISSRRKYARHVFSANVIFHGFPRRSQRKIRVNIIFFEEDALSINPCDDVPLVINMQHGHWNIMRILIDPAFSIGVMFWDTFQKLQLDPE